MRGLMKKVSFFVLLYFSLIAVVLFTGCSSSTIIDAEVKQGTIETTLLKDQELNTKNVIVIYTLANKSTMEIGSNDLVFSKIDSSTVGEKTLYIRYNDYSFGIKINVIDIVSGQIINGTLKTNVIVNDVLDTSKVQAKFVLSDNNELVVSSKNLVFGMIDTSTRGIKQLAINYKGFTFYQDINIRQIVSAEVMQNLNERKVVKNSNISDWNIQVKFTLDDNSSFFVSRNNLNLGYIDTSTIGTKYFDVDYKGFKFNTYVIVVEINKAEIVGNAFETLIFVGDKIDINSLQVKYTFNDDSSKILNSNTFHTNVDEIDTNQPKETYLNIVYYDFLLQIKISIIEKAPNFSNGMDAVMYALDKLKTGSDFKCVYSSTFGNDRFGYVGLKSIKYRNKNHDILSTYLISSIDELNINKCYEAIYSNGTQVITRLTTDCNYQNMTHNFTENDKIEGELPTTFEYNDLRSDYNNFHINFEPNMGRVAYFDKSNKDTYEVKIILSQKYLNDLQCTKDMLKFGVSDVNVTKLDITLKIDKKTGFLSKASIEKEFTAKMPNSENVISLNSKCVCFYTYMQDAKSEVVNFVSQEFGLTLQG